jgi:hypothetical protein
MTDLLWTSRNLAQKTGVTSHRHYQGESESNAASAGTTTWTQTSKRTSGRLRRTAPSFRLIKSTETSGAKSPSFCPEEQTITSKTASILLLKGKWNFRTSHLNQLSWKQIRPTLTLKNSLKSQKPVSTTNTRSSTRRTTLLWWNPTSKLMIQSVCSLKEPQQEKISALHPSENAPVWRISFWPQLRQGTWLPTLNSLKIESWIFPSLILTKKD